MTCGTLAVSLPQALNAVSHLGSESFSGPVVQRHKDTVPLPQLSAQSRSQRNTEGKRGARTKHTPGSLAPCHRRDAAAQASLSHGL